MPARQLWRTWLSLILGVGYAFRHPLDHAVDRAFAAGRYRKLFVRHRGIDEWLFSTPSTLGAPTAPCRSPR